MKKLLSIFITVFMLVSLFAGCNNSAGTENGSDTVPEPTEPVEESFSKNGLKITLPEEFNDYSHSAMGQAYTFLYASPYIGVLGIEDSKESLPDTVTDLAGYAAYQAEIVGVEATQKDGFWTLTYEDLTQNEPQTYVCVFYEAETGYWTVKSYCPSDLYETNQEAMWTYVTAATFN